ncbi:MAG: hypothetical protein WBX01_12355 [Nitrososphaeraceae archaeon]
MPLLGKEIMLMVQASCFALLMVGTVASLSNPVTAGGVEHDYDEDKYDSFEESDLNPENENYVGDDRIRELGGTPLSLDNEDDDGGNGDDSNDNNGNGDNNNDDSNNDRGKNYSPVLPDVEDLDCPDIEGTVKVIGEDVYGLDRDNDGIGCEDNV